MNDSHIVVGKSGATSFNGSDAVDLYRLMVLRQSIHMHQRFGMIPTRGVTITRMLGMVTAFSGKPYKGKTKHDAALSDLDARIAALKASMPIQAAA